MDGAQVLLRVKLLAPRQHTGPQSGRRLAATPALLADTPRCPRPPPHAVQHAAATSSAVALLVCCATASLGLQTGSSGSEA